MQKALLKLKVTLIISAILFLGFSSPAKSDEGWPRSVKDAFGRECVLDAPPKRIVTVFASNTMLIYSLGLTDLIVGIDALTFFPPEINKVPKIGGRLGISLEQVVARKPDLVLLTPARQAAHTLLAPLTSLHIPNMVLTSRDVKEIEDNLRRVAYITGTVEKGEEVIQDMEDRLLKVKLDREGKKWPRVVLITAKLSSGLFLVSRKGEYTSSIVELAGGILALDEQDEQRSALRISQISPEALIALDPDIIIVTRRRDEGTELYDYLQEPSFSQLKAQKDDQIHVVPSAEFLIPAPTVVDGVERLSVIFDRWNTLQ
ncbi:MAG: ABC transporter substrate-binding protein [Deltaproteobacteria bacterium]|jgi:iron complex transport system substrate-binding protein|nr:ABC transporter substrate-binding protein [Deltaproteobacteria bacterium]